MNEQPFFYSQLNPFSPAGSHLILSSLDKEWSGFAALFIQLYPIAGFEQEPAALTQVDRLVLHLSGSGQVEHVFDGQHQRGKVFPGSFSLTPRGYASAWSWGHPTKILNIYLFPTLLGQIAAETGQLAPNSLALRYLFNGHDPLIEQMGRSILSELQSGGAMSHFYTEALVHTLVIHLLRNYSSIPSPRALPPSGLTPRQLRRAKAYIQERLGEEISIIKLASTVGLSESHFSRQFKQSTGLSPHRYLIQCRVERAKALLHEGRLTIAEIARQVGFADQSHLTRHFQRVFGVSPGAVEQHDKNGQKESRIVQEDKH